MTTQSGFAAGQVYRNRYTAYYVTLVRPSGSEPGWWLVEPAAGQSHGKYVYSEESLREHFELWPPWETARCIECRATECIRTHDVKVHPPLCEDCVDLWYPRVRPDDDYLGP